MTEDSEHESPSVATSSTLETGGQLLPTFDRGRRAKNFVILGLGLAWTIAFGSLGFGIYTADRKIFNIRTRFGLGFCKFGLPFLCTSLVALCETCIGYAHSVALMWCLWYEKRLDYNTNTRLFAGSRFFWPNGRALNSLHLLALALAYASSGQIFQVHSATIRGIPFHDNIDVSGSGLLYVNGPAMLVFCVSLMIQLALCCASLYSKWCHIKSWNLDVLNIALARQSLGLTPVRGRCLMPAAYGSVSSPTTALPTSRQPTMFRTARFVRKHLALVWVALFITLIAATVLTLARGYLTSRNSHSVEHEFVRSLMGMMLNISSLASTHIHRPLTAKTWKTVAGTLVYTLFQSILTIGIYCAETIVLVSEDEKRWRRMTTSSGTILQTIWPKPMLKSLKISFLFCHKIICNYVFSQCISIIVVGRGYLFISFEWPRFWLLVLIFMISPVIATLAAIRCPHGPQPSTWGHHQTIVNLVDDWGKKERRLFWGDKGEKSEISSVRHAGTANHPLEKVNLKAHYC